jgi:branched-chain amino acid transport system substrate-binding protein
MKKRIFLLVGLLLLAAIMVACGPAAAPTEAPDEETPEATEAVEEPTEAVEEPTEAATSDAAGEMPEECADETACAVYAPGDPIRIGFGGPLTGENSPYGIDSQQAVELAFSDAGDFEGHAFELVAEDDGGTPEGGAAVANKHAADPTIAAIIGHNFSGATQNAIPIYQSANLPMVSPSATNPTLTTDGNTVFNRAVATDIVQGRNNAEFIYDVLGQTTLAIIHDGTTYGQGLADLVRTPYEEMGGEVVAYEAITPGETDYSAVLNSIAALEPGAVFFGGYVPEFAVMANQWAAAGLEGVAFVSGDGSYSSNLFELAGDNAEGLYVSSPVPADSDAKLAFDAAYLEAYGVEAGSLSSYTWNAYDAANVVMEAIKSVATVGADGTVYIPRAALVEAMRATSGYQGLTGEITCDEVGECAKGGFTLFIAQDGAFVAAEGQ